jgi:methylenetetrahydrofolate reductase (NADPH)
MTTFCQPLDPAPAEVILPVSELLADFSIEATPRQVSKIPSFAALLPAGTSVYVPFLPGAAFGETIDAARRLMDEAMRPVPHLAARAVPGRAQLDSWLGSLADAGVSSLLLIAGDLAEPAGPFGDTMQILDSGLLERHGFSRVGVAGHPDGHPAADEAALASALAYKQAYATATGAEMWVVTQFAFDAEPIRLWLDSLPGLGVTLPVRVGLPGPAKLRTLISFALSCGVAASARALAKRPDMAGKLLGQWQPDELVTALARHRMERPDGQLAGVHVFPFGGLKTSAAWFGGVRDGAIALPGAGGRLPEAAAPA